MSEQVAILGAGAFGSALAKLFAEGGHATTLFARDDEVVKHINAEHRHPRRLSSVRFPAGLKASSNLEEVMSGASLVVTVVPTVAVRSVWEKAKEFLDDDALIVSATKGIENETLMLVSDILKDVLPDTAHERLSYLSGPSFALELAKRLPTAVTVAAENESVAERVQNLVSTDYFRAYTTTDVVGVEVGGALKNVIAIAAGAADGLGFGLNTSAALITRGLAEIARMAVQMGANPLTMAGLAGMGDLVLTCTGTLSRNRTVGVKLGQGKKLPAILEELGQVAEGVNTAKSVKGLCQREGVEMPISDGVFRLLFDDSVDPRDAVFELMGRKLRSESA
ncbi:MAG: NAD(P)-dependent glycerol-3-phosphate dehydrogenase [Deltaproteobacteria bacterium]|nr:NAD(P)-dependent glycerol-3-phosphate dehydrogenase [Deltaproteobacteria bacterium]